MVISQSPRNFSKLKFHRILIGMQLRDLKKISLNIELMSFDGSGDTPELPMLPS